MTLVGAYVAESPRQLAEFEQWFGRAPDLHNVFLGLDTWDDFIASARRKFELFGPDRIGNLFWSVPLTVGTATLEQAATGAYDGFYRQAASIIAQGTPGTDVIEIRPGWEFNGFWFSWSAIGRESTYIAAYRELVDSFRSVSDRFRFEWTVNEQWDASPINPEDAYPGDAYVDTIGMDFYWREQFQGTDPIASFNYFLHRNDFGLQWVETFAEARGKATGYSEWGTITDQAAPFIQRLADWMELQDVEYHMYWDSNLGQRPDNRLSDALKPSSAAAYLERFATPEPIAASLAQRAQAPVGVVPVFDGGLLVVAATAFDVGGQGVSYFDSSPRRDLGGAAGRDSGVDIRGDNRAIGWISPGEWVEYSIQVERAGTYALRIAADSDEPGRSVSASFSQDDQPYRNARIQIYGTDSDSLRGFGTWVALEEGAQILRLRFEGGDFQFRSWSLQDVADLVPIGAQRGHTGFPTPIADDPVTIQAAQFDRGGNGVAFRDLDPIDRGGLLGRNEEVDIRGDNEAIAWTAAGEWVEYTIDVAEAGFYELTYDAGAIGRGEAIGTTIWRGSTPTQADDAAVIRATLSEPYRLTTPVDLELEAGVQVLRVTMLGEVELRSFTLERVIGFAPEAELRVQAAPGERAFLLENRKISGTVSVFLPDIEDVAQVEFYLNQTPAPGVAPLQTERLVPYDLLGGAPLDTRTLPEGRNTITAVLTAEDGQRQTLVTDFLVDNIA